MIWYLATGSSPIGYISSLFLMVRYYCNKSEQVSDGSSRCELIERYRTHHQISD
jgi:hypothetical protein